MLFMGSLVLSFASVACLVWGLLPDVSKRLIRQRLFSEVDAQSRLKSPTLWSRLAELLAPIHRRLPTTLYSAHILRRLQAGGLQIGPMQFIVMQEFGALTGLMIYVAAIGFERFNVNWLIFWVAVGALVPYMWLGNRIQARKLTFSRDLPEVVDLLSLCVDAGVDFMNALARVVREFRPCPTVDELGMVVQGVRIGRRRRDALQEMALRVQTPEASSFARTLIQADRMGTGMAESMRILSEDMRIKRYHWAERFAQRAPMKMMLPLVCSLAAALIIVAGPILGQFLQSGFTTMPKTEGFQTE